MIVERVKITLRIVSVIILLLTFLGFYFDCANYVYPNTPPDSQNIDAYFKCRELKESYFSLFPWLSPLLPLLAYGLSLIPFKHIYESEARRKNQLQIGGFVVAVFVSVYLLYLYLLSQLIN